MKVDFAIIGAGVIGLLTAVKLAEQGASVALFDKNQQPGQEASWAGGGIISPLYPWRYSAPVTQLASRAQEIYPNLCQHLLDKTDIDPEFKRDGLLMTQLEDQQKALLWGQKYRKNIKGVSAREVHDLEPCIKHSIEYGIYMPDVAQVRNPRLLKGLIHYLKQFPNVTWHLGHEVHGFSQNKQHITGIMAANARQIQADNYIVTTGAWTQTLLPDSHLHIQPVRGQMIVFEPSKIPLRKIVLNAGKYLIPRKDGRILIGSTLEQVGFNKSITEIAKMELLEAAYRMLPALQKVQVEKHWAGLRPGSEQGVPYIGPVPEYDNLFVNAGHFRNGLVLAPASVELLVSQLLKTPCDIADDAYNPQKRNAGGGA